jgi:formylglycine-generating enzyme required for sulfatase activity
MLQAVLAIFDREKSRGIELQVRLAAAEALGQAGDPRLRLPKDKDYWVPIPAGKFVMGESKRDDEPRHEVHLDAFLIGRYPVTVYEYALLLEDTGRKDPEDWDKQSVFPNRPVANVTWFDAEAYCRWAVVRLPTEAEWERAARGAEGRRYAWGDDPPDVELANYDKSGIGHASPIGLFPRGSTPEPENIADLAGNVWEWVSDWYGARYYEQPEKRNPMGPRSGSEKGLRGGSWYLVRAVLRAALRIRLPPGSRGDDIGFRCAREVFP